MDIFLPDLRILNHLWVQIVVALKNSYDKIPHSSANPLHIRLNFVLLELSDFFEADGKGLKRTVIESEYYMVCKYSLKCIPFSSLLPSLCFCLLPPLSLSLSLSSDSER